MPEVYNHLKTIKINYLCDKCGNGFMILSSNVIMMTDPPQHPHKCDKCGAEDTFTVCYPQIKHVDENEKMAISKYL